MSRRVTAVLMYLAEADARDAEAAGGGGATTRATNRRAPLPRVGSCPGPPIRGGARGCPPHVSTRATLHATAPRVPLFRAPPPAAIPRERLEDELDRGRSAI